MIEQKLNGVFRDVFQNKTLQITREMNANDVDNWTSITHVEMLAKVESAFGIRFSLKEVRKFKNVGDMMDAIENHINKN